MILQQIILHLHSRQCKTKLFIFFYVARYKIITQKSVVFLYTNNKLIETEIKEIIPFAIASKRKKYLGVNLPKGVKGLFSENCKTLMKDTEDNTVIKVYCIYVM